MAGLTAAEITRMGVSRTTELARITDAEMDRRFLVPDDPQATQAEIDAHREEALQRFESATQTGSDDDDELRALINIESISDVVNFATVIAGQYSAAQQSTMNAAMLESARVANKQPNVTDLLAALRKDAALVAAGFTRAQVSALLQ